VTVPGTFGVVSELGRREFLGLAGAAAFGFVAASCSSGSKAARRSSGLPARVGGPPLPPPGEAPFDVVVVLMMENRSFDHFLGWLGGADGRQVGSSYRDKSGALHATYALAPDYQGCRFHDPRHDWQSAQQQYNRGACDGWLLTQPAGETFPIGYYTAADLPITAALARGHTTLDRYFCSMMGPTGPNRLYAWSATTDSLEFNGILDGKDTRPSSLQLAIWDRLRAAGVTGGYYAGQEPNSYQYQSKKYDAITHSHDQFFDAAAKGKLPKVTFIDPDLPTGDEFLGTSYDDHPFNDVRQGEVFIAKVYRALATSPQWDRTVFVLTFDEHGGFYDHVAPPRVADDTMLRGLGPHPDLKRLGFRVPCIAMGPFAPARIVHSGPYEHCSILRMIEWRWNLPPMTARDRNARNFAEVLDFAHRRLPVDLPAFRPGRSMQCSAADVTARFANGGP
jgi:phospholipase C